MTSRPRNRHVFLILAALCAAAGVPGLAGRTAEKASDGAQVRDFTLKLAEFTFDPAQSVPQLPEGWDRSQATAPDLHLVQIDGPTKDRMIDHIRGQGLDVVQYVHPHTYIVWGTRSQRVALDGESFVRWSGDFAPAFRVQPQWRNLSAAAVDVKVLMYRGAGPDQVVRRIIELGGRRGSRRVLNKTFESATFALPGDRLQQAAGIPGVYSIRPRPTDGGLRSEMSGQVNVNNVDGSNIAFPGYPAWLSSVGLDGSGVILANVDSGIDDAHPDLANRMLPCTGSTCGTGSSGHGTHTAGIMAADGSSGVLDSGGFLRGLGVAPGANLVEQNYSPTFTQPGGMLTLIRDSYANGAVSSGNSWGPSGSPQGYDDDTMQVDIGVRDADPDTPGNQQFTYVLSFMNGNGGTSSQGTPDEAKNLFNIGSTKMRTGSGAQDANIDDLSANSAHGPALDGRTIPHMVAPGCQVDSTLPGSSHGLDCGTSMASPQVSGGVALFFEYYRGLPDYTVDPSPALVKAAFLAVARSLEGHLDADGGVMGTPFDSKQGWGRMDLEAVLDSDPNGVRYFDDPQLFDNSGEEWVQSMSPLDPGQPVRIMLVWTDAPGHGLGGSTPAWNNDLDLLVEVGGDTYRGNNIAPGGFSVPGGVADSMNNTEAVFLDPAPAGGMTVRVVATDVNSDGVPGTGDATDQDFALVCYNCALEPGFILSTADNAEQVCAPAAAAYSIDVGSILGFNDPVTLSVSGVPAGASSSFTVNPVTPAGTSSLQIGETASASAGSYTIVVDGVAGSVSRVLTLQLELNTALPAVAGLLQPADGAIDLSTQPTLEWSPAAQASSYLLEIATDPAFSNIVYSAQETATVHVVESALGTLTTHYWRVGASNFCGTASYSATSSFTTLDVPPILLVDDDDNGPDVRSYYTDALDALGAVYDVWDTGNSDSEPDAAALGPYEVVIWFTGDEFGGAAGPGASGENALASWLDGVGCLLLSSQDYVYDRGVTAFAQSRLGVDTATSDTSQTTATGVGSVFAGLGPYTLSYPYSNFSDTITADASSELAFDGDAGNLAVNKNTGLYRTSFLGFGVETLPTPADQQTVIGAFLDWCATLPQDDGDLDGASNENDCAPADPAVWAAPSAARSLSVSPAGDLAWSAPLAPGANAPSYDVLRSTDPGDFSLADCVDSDLAVTASSDVAQPLAGQAFFYLIRVRNGCGQSLGLDSFDVPRPSGAACP